MNVKTLLLISLVFLSFSCSSNKKREQNNIDSKKDFFKGNVENQGFVIVFNSDSDSKKAGELESAHFEFNSSTIEDNLQKILDKDTNVLLSHNNINVHLEGNCDERGSLQLNLALGEKRAKFVRDYLISNGIKASRINVVSYGNERPIAFGHNDESWSKNRRVNFVVTKI
jgi:peptidoglycan-associated lipoprotein